MADFLKSALPLLLKGWSIFPVKPDSKIPLTIRGFKDATKNKEQVLVWASSYPTANIGVATGAMSGLAVVDVDVKNGKTGKHSIAMIKGLIPEKTYTVKTPSKGLHYYYSISEPVKSRNGFMPGVDIKADGGYVVGPGSEIEGKFYRCLLDVPLLDFRLTRLVAKRKEPIPEPSEIRKMPRTQVDDLVAAARAIPIEQIVERTGFIVCPWHDDHRPSAWVKNGFGYCFPCGKRFDSIEYVRKTKNLNFMDAVRYLCGQEI